MHISHNASISSPFPCPLAACIPVYLLPFLLPLHRLSSPVMEAYLSPADIFMSNGCGRFLYEACGRQEARRAAGRTEGGFIWAGRPSLYHHANRDSSTGPGAPRPDKTPRQSSAGVRPHSPQWRGQTVRDQTAPTALHTILLNLS